MSTESTRSLRVIVFGAAGDVGRRMVGEASRRGHRVTAVTRSPSASVSGPGVSMLVRDVESADDLQRVIGEHDVVISALRPRDGDEERLVALTGAVVRAARGAGTRFIVVGGAASLWVRDSPGHTVLTAPGFLPDAYLPIATACQAQHDWIVPRLDGLGSYLCPPAELTPGERTGSYRLGDDTLVTDESGASRISMEDFAVAALDEAERPVHVGRRFTVGT